MRKLLLLFALCAIVAQAQDSYFPQSMVWKADYQTFCGDETADGWKSDIRITEVKGDTLINGITYQLIGNTPVRAEGKKIYCYIKLHDASGTDVLLYDFSLEVGDKISQNYYDHYYEAQPLSYATVTAVDYVTLLDGRQAKRLRYDNRSMDIEYLGAVSESSSGLFNPLSNTMPTCARWQFLCCSLNGEPLYETAKGDCDKEVADAIENIATPVLTVSPNPVHNYLELQGVEAVSEVLVYDLSGQCVLRSCAKRVDVTTLPSGIYLLRATDKNGKAYQSKFVKE